ncbi:MAG: PAS domain-containing protein [Chloroflexales bacterium]
MNTSSETIAQLHAENQRLRARIAAQEADTTRTPAIISDITFAPPIWLNVVSDAIFVTDARHQIVFWNRAAEQIYGWSHAEVVGRPITEVIRVVRYVSGESIASVLNTLMTTGSWRGEVIHHTRNGHEVIVDSLVHQIADNQGTIAHYVGIHRDVTARVYADAALRTAYAQIEAHTRSAIEHAARLDSLLAHAPIGIALLDTELRYQHINVTLAAMNGVAPEAHLGRTIREELPGLVLMVEPPFRQVLTTGEPILNIEICGENPVAPGVFHIWHTSYFPVRAADGTLLGVGIIVMDVTAQRQAEQARDAEHQQREAILQTLDVGVLVLTPDGKVTAINRAAYEYMGIHAPVTRETIPDMMKASSITLCGSDGIPLSPAQSPAACVLRGERFRDLEMSLRGHDAGDVSWLSFSGGPVCDADGTLVLGVVTGQDITSRKRAEDAVQAQADALIRTNAELTRALRVKDEFLAMMSHELRTPLNGILGISECLDEGVYGPISAPQRQAITTVRESGKHLLAILSDILDLTRIDADLAHMDLHPVDVDSICELALQIVQNATQQKDVHLRYRQEHGVADLCADERRLIQILTNLLTNAVTFTPSGGTVGLDVTTDVEQECIQFVVWDTGIGIAEADLGRLFQPFTQLDSRLSRLYEGTGLGLALVRRLAEAHGGRVDVTSILGQGSRFTVSLPLRERGEA